MNFTTILDSYARSAEQWIARLQATGALAELPDTVTHDDLRRVYYINQLVSDPGRHRDDPVSKRALWTKLGVKVDLSDAVLVTFNARPKQAPREFEVTLEDFVIWMGLPPETVGRHIVSVVEHLGQEEMGDLFESALDVLGLPLGTTGPFPRLKIRWKLREAEPLALPVITISFAMPGDEDYDIDDGYGAIH